MKNLLLLLLLITGIAQAQIINFPDANFKAKLLTSSTDVNVSVESVVAFGIGGQRLKIDTNDDGEIQMLEAQAVDSLNVMNGSIADLSGISDFSNLKRLDCTGNQLSTLDVTSLLNLTTLNFGGNSISAINVNGLVNLKRLICYSNNLTSLNISALINLEELVIFINQFTTIDLTGNTNLKYFHCQYNQFTTLNVDSLPNLKSFWFGNPGFSDVDVSNLTNLETIECYYGDHLPANLENLPKLEWLALKNSSITHLDLSQLLALNGCYMLDNSVLEYINLKNGGAFVTGLVAFLGNPVLNSVCVNGVDLQYISEALANNNPTAQASPYCTFAPGGDFNTIEGIAKFDQNNNGCTDDDFQPNIKMTINDGTFQGASFTTVTGNYKFYIEAGSFDIVPDVENPTWFSFSPATATIPFADDNNNLVTQDFCVAPVGFHPDLEIVIAPIDRARPGFEASYQIVYKNKGNQILSGDVNFTYNDAVLDFVSATVSPDSQSTGSLGWNYTSLNPFESKSIYLTLKVNSPMETPAVNSGDILDFSATVNPISGDETPADNVFEFHQTVVNSLDPNIKQCVEGDVVSPSEIGSYLHYIIDFENIGTTEAENIVVKDSINISMFDIKTLQIMNSSHAVETKVTGNIVEFIFKGIKLPAGGHGNILLKIKTRNDLHVGDVVSNKADIFFDYNFPIETNLAKTQFQSLSTNDYAIDQSVSIYPNPSKGNVLVKANGNIKSVQLFDIQGRVLETRATNEQELKMDISKYSNGVYFLKVLTDVGIKIEKLIKN